MKRRAPQPQRISRYRPPQTEPRRTHLTGLILTGSLLIGLVGTLGLTFAVALSASTGKHADTRGETAPTFAAISAPVESREEPTEIPPTPTAEPTPTAQPASPPDVSAQAAFALDADTGEALIALNPDEQRPIASLTKMVSALVVANAIGEGVVSLADEVVIEDADIVDVTVYSHMGLVAGDTLTVEQLLDGMLIPSGNDAAKALARYVGTQLAGGEEGDPTAAFVAAMNDVVADLGLQDTQFGTPDGDDDEGNYSTARDLAQIGARVMESRLLVRIVAIPQVTITSVGPERRQFELFNTNYLLNQSGIDGVKTGTTAGAGACLVASTLLPDGRRVVVVVLGSDLDPADAAGDPLDWPRFADARAIIDQIETGR
ncbi:MAG: hypothetical protein QOF01_2890 [Thermomicrobiales bacterium]|nr:hypothetical protein [Thermomicrobiales bacterium]